MLRPTLIFDLVAASLVPECPWVMVHSTVFLGIESVPGLAVVGKPPPALPPSQPLPLPSSSSLQTVPATLVIP